MRVYRKAVVPYGIWATYILSNFCNNIDILAVP
jgi:hypothetical protein